MGDLPTSRSIRLLSYFSFFFLFLSCSIHRFAQFFFFNSSFLILPSVSSFYFSFIVFIVSCSREIGILSFGGGLRPPSELLSGYHSFHLLSRLVGFIVLVIYKSLIDAGAFTRNYSFLAGPSFLPGETSLGGLDISVSDTDHLLRRDCKVLLDSCSYSFHPCAKVRCFQVKTLVLTF